MPYFSNGATCILILAVKTKNDPNSLNNTGKSKIVNKSSGYDILGTRGRAHLLWSGLTYQIKEGRKDKVILDNIGGWVRLRTLTAHMRRIHAFVRAQEPELTTCREYLGPGRSSW